MGKTIGGSGNGKRLLTLLVLALASLMVLSSAEYRFWGGLSSTESIASDKEQDSEQKTDKKESKKKKTAPKKKRETHPASIAGDDIAMLKKKNSELYILVQSQNSVISTLREENDGMKAILDGNSARLDSCNREVSRLGSSLDGKEREADALSSKLTKVEAENKRIRSIVSAIVGAAGKFTDEKPAQAEQERQPRTEAKPEGNPVRDWQQNSTQAPAPGPKAERGAEGNTERDALPAEVRQTAAIIVGIASDFGRPVTSDAKNGYVVTANKATGENGSCVVKVSVLKNGSLAGKWDEPCKAKGK